MHDFRLLIGGNLVPGDLTMAIVNPATASPFAECPRASPAQLDQAMRAARRAQPAWAETTIAVRQEALRDIAFGLESRIEEIARVLTLEQGKPLDRARLELQGAIRFFRHTAEQHLDIEVLEQTERKRVEIHRKPLGVVAAIVPWNFPIVLMAWKAAPALLAGNTVVIKPAPTTPLSTLLFGEVVASLVPSGVVNVIVDDNDLGDALTAHPEVDKVSFTGSVATGRRVMASAAAGLKHLTLELGGNDAAIVLGDVEPRNIAQAIFDKAFANNGQFCSAIKRLYVHDDVYDQMCAELTRIADGTVVGDGLEQGSQLGPLQNKRQFERVRELIADAGKNGRVTTRQDVVGLPGYFIRPTIVRDVSDGTQLVDEEQFGPVLPVLRFSDENEAVARANATSFGLGASVWSSDRNRARQIADRLEAGMVGVNKHAEIENHIPFGGSKQSGFGWELGREGLHAYTQMKVVNIAL